MHKMTPSKGLDQTECVGNGQRRYHFFGQSWTSPKTVSFGEVVPAEWLGNVARRFMLEGSDSYEG